MQESLKDEADANRAKEEASMVDFKSAQEAEAARIAAEEESAAEELRKTAEATKANRNVFAKMEAVNTSPGRQGKDALVREAFEEFDSEGSGFLEFSEVGAMLERLGLRISSDEIAKCVSEMEEKSSTADGKIDFPEFLSWWKTQGSGRKKGSIAEKIAARKKAEQEAAGREAEDMVREKEERAARAKEQSEARKKKSAAKAESEAAAKKAEEAELQAYEEAEKKAAEEKAARWKDKARRERCVYMHVNPRRWLGVSPWSQWLC